jgi:hypothetical protein
MFTPGQQADVQLTDSGAILGKDTRQCSKCGRIYVLREYVNPCPVCKTALPKEAPTEGPSLPVEKAVAETPPPVEPVPTDPSNTTPK